ncbi:MAG: hypothetical protein ACQETH_12110 [Candidatus Rifleibacteriota bacterium]
MADKKQNNKRIKYGLVFFVVLILANLIVRIGNRKNTTPAPDRGATQTTLPDNQQPQVQEEQVSAAQGSLTSTYLDLQIKKLNTRLEIIKRRVEGLPEPARAPDTNQALFLSRKSIFRKVEMLDKPIVVKAATETEKIATQATRLELIGTFLVQNKEKLLLKKGNKVYLVEENNMHQDNKYSYLTSFNNTYTIIDEDGNERVLKLKEEKNTEVEKIIEIIKNSNKQPVYEIAQNASSTEELQVKANE